MKYVPGLLAGQLSGKAGNTVASRNRNGSYFRTRTIPKLVRNAKTTGVRTHFTFLSQAFRALTATQISAWNALGADVKRKNSVGEAYSLTGLQAFQSVNRVKQTIGEPVVDTPPAVISPPEASGSSLSAVPDFAVRTTTVTTGATSATQLVASTADVLAGDVFDDVTAVVSANVLAVVDGTHVLLDAIVTTVTADSVHFVRPVNLTVNFNPSPIPADVVLILYATPPLSNGVSRPSRNAYRYVTQYNAGNATGAEVNEEYAAAFGPPTPGSRVFYKFVYASTSGFLGSPYESFVAA